MIKSGLNNGGAKIGVINMFKMLRGVLFIVKAGVAKTPKTQTETSHTTFERLLSIRNLSIFLDRSVDLSQ